MKTKPHEEVTTKDLMNFMTLFRDSMEEKIKKTNDKLDDRLNIVEKEINVINVKIDRNEMEGKYVMSRMDARLSRLELEMNKSLEIQEKRRRWTEKQKTRNIQPSGSAEEQGKKTLQQSEDTLEKVVTEQVVIQDHVVIQEKPHYRSSWASAMEKELEQAAAAGAGGMDKGETAGRVVNEERVTPESWGGAFGAEEAKDEGEKATDQSRIGLEKIRKTPQTQVKKKENGVTWRGERRTH